ncbi:MAG: hypothetical protein ACOY71_09525 [Gemmatimonadota bacterium]
MNRVIWWLIIATFLGGLVALGSFAGAYVTMGKLLGDPPPDMGIRTVRFAWQGAPRLKGHPRTWIFSFRNTAIPGTPTVTIYVSPRGELLGTEPADLPARVTAFRRVPY